MNDWQREAARLIYGMGCSMACAEEMAQGVLAQRARNRGLSPKDFNEKLRWLYGRLPNLEDRILRSIEAESDRAFEALQWTER